jgi:homoserine kinase type II
MDGIAVAEIATHWQLTPPVRLEPIAAGMNNRSWLVRSGSGIYVLKWYRNMQEADRLRFEHALLGALAAAELPFAVPSPLPARSGDTSIRIETGSGPARTVLSRHIPGRAAAFGSIEETGRCGAALASLDKALATIELDPGIPVPTAFDALGTIHPLVPDPVAAIERLPGDSALRAALVTAVPGAEQRWREHRANWATQLIHGDYYPSNTLVHGGEVSGIVDFEYSSMGYRAMDFAVGLAAFSTRSWEEGCAWPLVSAFAEGYLSQTPLSEPEIMAIPSIMRLREAVSFIHWQGRMEQGLTPLDDIHDRGRRLLSLRRWLERHQDELVDRIIRLRPSRHPES